MATSRTRSFLRTASHVALGAAGISLAGCGETSTTNISINVSSPMEAGAAIPALDGGPADAPSGASSTDATFAPDSRSTPPIDAPNGSAVATYLGGLPGWPAPLPNSNGPVDAGADAAGPNYVTGTATSLPDGGVVTPILYACTTTEYSLTSTPTQIVTFNPNVDVLWPGALLQGGPYQQGQLVSLPITQRAPLTVSIPTLLSANNSAVVDMPTVATTENAVGAIIAAAVDAGIQASSSVSYTQTEAHSVSQLSLSLGFSASYIGGDLSSQLNLSSSADLNTVVGYFVQNMFTVTIPEPEQPSDLFAGLTQDTLNQLTAAGDIGPANLPIYVSSVVYGRLMMFSITSKQSTQNIEGALSAQFHGGFASGSVNTQYSQLLADSSTTFSVVTVGGSAQNAEALIESGDPSKFFDSDPQISTGVPISYVVRNLSDNSVAGVSQTTDYSVKTCTATAITAGANYYVVDKSPLGAKGIMANVDSYDVNGASDPPTHAITLPDAVPNQEGDVFGDALAYDSANDRFYAIVESTTPGTNDVVDVFGPDGTSYGSFETPFQGEEDGISYDATHDRIYVTGTSGLVLSYTPGGEVIDAPIPGGCPYLAFYVASNDELYCLNGQQGVQAYHFGLYDAAPLPAGAFGAMSTAAAVTSVHGNGFGCDGSGCAFAIGEFGLYDPTHDHVIIGFNTDVWSFTPSGTLVTHFALNGHLAGLTYDTVNAHVAAALDNATVQLFNEDGSLVREMPGAFSGFGAPQGLAFRP